MSKIKRIIIEGPDCSGKSTLVDRIKNTLRWDAKSLHHKETDQFDRYLAEYANNSQTVFDRSHISEIVYGGLWRGGNPFTKVEQEILDRIVGDKSLIIFVCPKADVLKKRYLERKFSQQISLSELESSRNHFKKIMKNFKPIRYYSSSWQELELLIKKIEKEVFDENICLAS